MQRRNRLFSVAINGCLMLQRKVILMSQQVIFVMSQRRSTFLSQKTEFINVAKIRKK